MSSQRLDCFSIVPKPPKLVASSTTREWMTETKDHFAYRCTPLAVANSTGWELLNPVGFSATWTGHNDREGGIVVRPHVSGQSLSQIGFYFGHGILSFHPGYLFRTDPGWVVSARGSPNRFKDGIHPLEGLIETNWLPYPFTMNWRFTRPCTVQFEQGEPFCFLTVVPSTAIEAVQPRIMPIESEPELEKEYKTWSADRAKFNSAIYIGQAKAAGDKWQKYYLAGRSPTGGSVADEDHRIKRSLREPIAGCPFKPEDK